MREVWGTTGLMRLLTLDVAELIRGTIDARRKISGVSALVSCCPGAALFFIANSRAVVNGDEIGSAPGLVDSCSSFCSVPGPLQTVQRTEFWEVILALQALDAVHLGVDNLNVVRQVGRLLDGADSSRPAELMNDGDLIDQA